MAYAGADPFAGFGCGSIQLAFRSQTTDFTTVVDTGFARLISVYFNDIDPDNGGSIVRRADYTVDNNQNVTISQAGYSIGNVQLFACTIGTADCGHFDSSFQTGIKILSLSASQPVTPTLNLSVNRNGDGSFSAVVDYNFPVAGDLSVSLAPTKQEAGATLYTQSGVGGSGTITVPLPAFDSERTLRAVGTGCDGNAEATAAVAGCKQCNPPTKVGSPIRLFDGVMTYTETDPLPSTIGTEFRREYSSIAAADGRFGLGWSSVFDASAVPITTDNKYIEVVTEDRAKAVFKQLITGAWQQTWPSGGVQGTLTGSETVGYIFWEASGAIVRTFGTNHQLTRIQDLRQQRAVSIAYDLNGNPATIADENGTWSCTITSANNHVISISVDGRPDLSWTYTYEGSLLSSVTVGGAATAWRTYQYSGNRISAILDATGAALERHDYDAQGRAISNDDRTGGDLTNITYAATDASGVATTTVTRADNSEATYEQVFSAGNAVTRHADGGCASCGAENATAAYDTKGNIVRLQNARGYITESDYDTGSHHVVMTTTALVPSGCDPATDANHCRLTADMLAAAVLSQTTASLVTTYSYDDTNWPANPTQILKMSVFGGFTSDSYTYDRDTGEPLTHTERGYIDANNQETHTTTMTLYRNGDTALFAPGGTFETAWLPLQQPIGLQKSVDGPRTDVNDVIKFVYYPIDSTVPGAWRGKLAAVQDAAGHVTRYQDYDVFGHATTTIDVNGVSTHTTYDALGRLMTTTTAAVAGCNTAVDPLCASDLTTTQTYLNTTGPLGTVQRPAANITTYAYDARGRLQTLTRGTTTTALEKMDYTYDATTGKKATETTSAFQNSAWVVTKSESYAYTSDGHLSMITHADNTRQLFTYFVDGMLASAQDENHTTPNTTYAYDPENRLTTLTQTLASAPGGQITTHYAYDIQGNLIAVTDPNGNTTTYVVDDFGRMRKQTSPVSGTTTYTYDVAGNMTTTTDANSATTTRTYDALNRVTTAASTRSGTTESVSWTYDDSTSGNFGIGRLATMTDPTGSTAYQYERRGLLRSEAKTIGSTTYTTAYTYDGNGNVASINYPSGLNAAYTSDFADRPASLTAGGTSIVSSAMYLPFGPMSSLNFGNGTVQQFQYDTRYRMVSNTLSGAAVLANYQYTLDNAGNITGISDLVPTVPPLPVDAYSRTFGYDDLNRLTSANTGAALWLNGSYAYDSMGNMTSMNLGATRALQFMYQGTTPKLQSVVGTSPSLPSYDNDGNELTSGRSYNPRNEMNHIATSTVTLDYNYDGRGVRVNTTSTSAVPLSQSMRRYAFYSPQLHLLAQTAWQPASASGNPPVATDFLWFGARPVAQKSVGGPVRYTFADHLGTPLIQTDATGSIIWRGEYEPYGNIYSMRVGSAADQPLRLPGQEVAEFAEDNTEQAYNIFRWYRAGWRRYTQADPLTENPLRNRMIPSVPDAGETVESRAIHDETGLSRLNPQDVAAGTEPYAYGSDNPLRLIDPLGLYPCVVYSVNSVADYVQDYTARQGKMFKGCSYAGVCGPPKIQYLVLYQRSANIGCPCKPLCIFSIDLAKGVKNGQAKCID